MLDEIQGKIIDNIKGFKEQGVTLPTRVVENSAYSKIPENLGEINGLILANYLAYWTAMTNWSGYNLSSLKAKVDYLKRHIARVKTQHYLSLDMAGTIKDKEMRVNNSTEVLDLEEEMSELLLKSNMMDYIYDANVRTLSLFSREISRRSSSFREDYSPPTERPHLPTAEEE